MIDLGALLGAPVDVIELKRKPGRRVTSRASGPRGTAIVKRYASTRAPVVAARLDALRSGPAEPLIPRVLAVWPERHTVALSEVPGVPLRGSAEVGDEPLGRRVGAVLADWHRAWRGTGEPFRPHRIEDEMEVLGRWAAAAPTAIGTRVRDAAVHLQSPWPCTGVVHRDLYEEQILVGDRVGLIDLDDAALGPPELDIGNLLAHFDLLGLRTGAGGPAKMAAAVVDGYRRMAALDDTRLRQIHLLSRLRLACIHGEPSLLD